MEQQCLLLSFGIDLRFSLRPLRLKSCDFTQEPEPLEKGKLCFLSNVHAYRGAEEGVLKGLNFLLVLGMKRLKGL